MENTLMTGLYVSVISMAVTFIALGILIGVMYALLAIFPDKSKQVAGDEFVAMIEEPEVDEKANQELAVAMAVGMALLEHQGAFDAKDPNLGKLLE